ncbi:uncharacterized protein LOC127387776 [Apus apus]|uniref:uncharacterized protein LOC127387776 n=1 Tax=Apus apus TaxID=8895 RepID=UPI0021F87D3A|nr:uncharacterized protein LOC127387776 [Apus apus]
MGQASCCFSSREAEVLLSADVQLTRGRKRSKRRLLLFQEELVVAKLQGGTTLRPQLCLALDQLWVFSCGKEEVREQEEKEGGSKEDGTSLLFSWPRGSCIVDFGSQELKELWLGTLRGTPEGARGGRVNLLPSVQLLEKELSHHHAWKTLSARSLEMLVEGQAEADPKQGHAPGPPSNGRGLCHALGEFWKERQPPASD